MRLSEWWSPSGWHLYRLLMSLYVSFNWHLWYSCNWRFQPILSQEVHPQKFHIDTPPKQEVFKNLSPASNYGVILGYLFAVKFWVGFLHAWNSPWQFGANSTASENPFLPTSFWRARSFSAERCSNISTCRTEQQKSGVQIQERKTQTSPIWNFQVVDVFQLFANSGWFWLLTEKNDNNQSLGKMWQQTARSNCGPFEGGFQGCLRRHNHALNMEGPKMMLLEKVDSLYNMAIFGIYVRDPGGTSPKFYIANPLNNGWLEDDPFLVFKMIPFSGGETLDFKGGPSSVLLLVMVLGIHVKIQIFKG